MTENTDTPQDSATEEAGVQQADTTPEETTPDDSEESPSREAAKWRTKFRESEAQMTAQAERIAVLQRAEVERRAAGKLAAGSDVWLDGGQLADVLDDDGNVDSNKVDDLVATVLGAHRNWARLSSAAAPASEVTGSDKVTSGGDTYSFEDAFKPQGAR